MEKVLAIINIIVGLLAFSLQVINTTTCCVIGPYLFIDYWCNQF
jgi:hypothetical protein